MWVSSLFPCSSISGQGFFHTIPIEKGSVGVWTMPAWTHWIPLQKLCREMHHSISLGCGNKYSVKQRRALSALRTFLKSKERQFKVKLWGKQGCRSLEEQRGDLKFSDITGQQLPGSGHSPGELIPAIHKDPLLLNTICSLLIFLRQWTWFCALKKKKIMQQSIWAVRWRAAHYSQGHNTQWRHCNDFKGQNNNSELQQHLRL